MKITHEYLVGLGASCEQLDTFSEEWPDGAEVTLDNCLRAAELHLNLDWLAEKMFPARAREAFEQARAPALEAYRQATAPAREAFEQARATAWEAYEQATAPAREAFEQARATAWEAYEQATAPALEAFEQARATAWEAYEQATAPAFYKIYGEIPFSEKG